MSCKKVYGIAFIYSESSNRAEVCPKKITPCLNSHYWRLLNTSEWTKLAKNPPYCEESIKKIVLFENFLKIFTLLQGIALLEHYFCLKLLPYLRNFLKYRPIERNRTIWTHFLLKIIALFWGIALFENFWT